MPTTAATEDLPAQADAGPFVPSPSTESDIEEGRDSYRPGRFHPMYIGDIYADKYKS